MASIFAFGVCTNGRYQNETRLTYCNVSIALRAFLPKESGKGAIYYLERGILNSELGHETAAKDDFLRAISDASEDSEKTIVKGYWLQKLIVRMEQEDNESRSFWLWQSVLTNF